MRAMGMRAAAVVLTLVAAASCTAPSRRARRPRAPDGKGVSRRKALPPDASSAAPARPPDVAAAEAAKEEAKPFVPPPVPPNAAVLEGPYEDPLQQRIRFGDRSFYLTPWRAYVDTWPARQFLDCLGCAFNGVNEREADAVAEVLAEAGVRQVRIEVGWGSFRFDDPTRLKDHEERGLAAKLRAVKKHGVRPLILLNANSGWPCPIREFRVKLVKDAPAGAREIVIDRTDEVRLHHTGLRGQGYQVAFPLITNVDAATGRCELSAPLKKPVKAGSLSLFILKYRPFAGTVFADGRPNPSARDTFDGWMKYVAGICRACKSALGTEGAADAGFDLEVWNEYTFGSQFLEIKNYCEPRLAFRELFTYSRHGRTKRGHEAILPMTIDYAKDPANSLPGVRVIDGFSNQRPWESGTGMWPGQAGFSRHYYTGTELREISLERHVGGRDKVDGPLNALGERDGEVDGRDWNTVRPETTFVPRHVMSMPEYWHHAYQTEFITRDVQPFPGPWQEHHRYSHNGDGRTAQVWRTESNYWRSPLGGRLKEATGCKGDDPQYKTLMHEVGAKALLRLFTFRSHRGEHTNTVYNVKGRDDGFAVIPEAFFSALNDAGHKLTDDVRAKRGRQLEVIGRVARMMAAGKPIDVARKLTVEKLVEHSPRLVFKGDGTPGRPDRHHRDAFACLPFQLAADRFAVGYYVVTRNMLKEWRPEKDALDPERYAMPAQTFDLTLTNVRGAGAEVRAYDPMTDGEVPVEVLATGRARIAVRLSVVDYPRFLVVVEDGPGPLVVSPVLRTRGKGARLTFRTNVEAAATVTWGPHPFRTGGSRGGIRGEYFAGMAFEEAKLARKDPLIAFDWPASPAPGVPADRFSVRWEGTLVPDHSETYTFHTVSDDGVRLWVDGRQLIDNWTNHGATEDRGTIELAKGRAYRVRMEFYENSGGASARLLWSSASQRREPVPFSRFAPADGPPDGLAETRPGREHVVDIDELGEAGAVRITVAKDGLVCRWPQWDWDVRGALRFAPPAEGARDVRGALELPELAEPPGGKRPTSWTAKLPEPRRWSGDTENATLALEDERRRVFVELLFVPGDIDAVRGLMPSSSVSDTVTAGAVDWNGAPGWRVEFTLDAAAHPGLRERRQLYMVAPVAAPAGDGHLVLAFRGEPEAFGKLEDTIAEIARGVEFR